MHFSASFNKKKMEVLICSAPVISAVECLNSDIYAGAPTSYARLGRKKEQHKWSQLQLILANNCQSRDRKGLTPKGQKYLEYIFFNVYI